MIGGLKDKSVSSLGATSATLLAADGGRVYLLIVNTHATVDCWINLTGGTATPHAAGSIRLAANGGYYEQSAGGFCPTGLITGRMESGTGDITIKEG